MKIRYIKKNAAAALVCVGLGMLSCAIASHAAPKKSDTPAQGGGDTAQLVIVRTASVGSGVTAAITLDGKDLATLGKGRSYRGPLSAGKHVISVEPYPNTSGQQPTKTEFMAEKGQKVSFKVSSKSGKVTLEKTQ